VTINDSLTKWLLYTKINISNKNINWWHNCKLFCTISLKLSCNSRKYTKKWKPGFLSWFLAVTWILEHHIQHICFIETIQHLGCLAWLLWSHFFLKEKICCSTTKRWFCMSLPLGYKVINNISGYVYTCI